MIKLRIIESYHDSEVKRVLNVGEIIQTSNEGRAKMLIERGLVERITATAKPKDKRK